MGAGGNIFSVPPHAPFLETLARALIDGAVLPGWPRQGPFWLSDITIFLPTRRARGALADALVAALGGAPMLLPDIRTLGGEDPSEEPFLPPYEAVALPPAMSRVKRRLLLAQLIGKWLATRADTPFSAPALGGYRGGPNIAEVLALADSLGTLIDDFAIAGRDLSDLEAIETGQLAEQFLANLDFVRFIFANWPAILKAEGEMDASARTTALLHRHAQVLPKIYGERPVIVAGSTGSMPATAELIAAIAALPRGAVVLPGLDTGLDPMRTDALRTDRNNPHGHPQYGLVRLLDTLGVRPEAVETLGPSAAPRTEAVRAALVLAPETARWGEIGAGIDMEAAAEGIALVAARNPEEEARAIAIAVHDALANHRTAAVITPDQTLARRIAAELRRAGINADDAAGTPLHLSRAGRLVRQAVTLVVGRYAPVDLMALLRNRHVELGLGRAHVAPIGETLDLKVLRGQRPGTGISGLKTIVAAMVRDGDAGARRPLSLEDARDISALLDALDDALAPLEALIEGGAFRPAQLAVALDETLMRLRTGEAGGAPEPLEGEAELGALLETLARQGERGPMIERTTLPLALDGLMAGQSVRPHRPPHEGVTLYGRLEARLMTADRVILAGLVEGVWPEVADPGPWLSRGMRMGAGLEPPEKLHGLAAHDFEMAMGAPEVILTLSERQGTGPATPSRLVQRLEGFFGADRFKAIAERGAVWRDLARRLDLTGQPPRAETRPAPTPPKIARPKKLSITDAETLLRSPYDIYAKYVLGLRKIEPLGADPDLAERGTIIHDIVGDFIVKGHDIAAPDALDTLMGLARTRFAALDAIPARRDLWLSRFAQAAHQFLDFERQRDARVAKRHAEIEGEWQFPQDGEAFTLKGRADRIDLMASGKLEIIDFKTGSIPSQTDMKDFFAPQLPLEAVMARGGGFDAVPAADAEALTYIKIGSKPDAVEPTPFALPKNGDLDTAIAETFRRFIAHISKVLMQDDQPMTARVFPKKGQRFRGDYEHLARTGEWALTESGEDEGE
ncbi:double-strand break repair protein AddB [Pelagibacterium sediminicola]|uniref:double-strand break repair protein AddB n=1 Tax=Pelagibacterium sediminicola TaxID=2248761 RepID=UPI000E3116E8|nr:double-strand break repair protein AddB [Pelagibacterium sediminicola]